MPLPTLTNLPDAPNPGDGEEAFDAAAFPFVAALQDMVPELRSFGEELEQTETDVAANALAANLADVDLSTIPGQVIGVNADGDGVRGYQMPWHVLADVDLTGLTSVDFLNEINNDIYSTYSIIIEDARLDLDENADLLMQFSFDASTFDATSNGYVAKWADLTGGFNQDSPTAEEGIMIAQNLGNAVPDAFVDHSSTSAEIKIYNAGLDGYRTMVNAETTQFRTESAVRDEEISKTFGYNQLNQSPVLGFRLLLQNPPNGAVFAGGRAVLMGFRRNMNVAGPFVPSPSVQIGATSMPRTAANAQAAFDTLADGGVFSMDGLQYRKNAATALADSATQNIGVAGIDAVGVGELGHYGLTGDGTDETALADFAWSKGRADLGGLDVRLEAYETTDRTVKAHGPGILRTTLLSDEVLRLNGPYAHDVQGIEFQQPNDPSMSGGTANNHQCLKVLGGERATVRDVKFTNPDLCLTVGHGPVTMTDRAAKNCTVVGAEGVGVRGMGMEIFGSKRGHFSGLVFEGTDGSTGRAMFHGLRLSGYDFAPNRGNYAEATVSGFANGLSIQQYDIGNNIVVSAEDCGDACEVYGQDQAADATTVSKHNNIEITAQNCDRVLYDGGSYNTFKINATNCAAGIFQQADDGVAGLSIGNTYIGSITASVGDLAELRGNEGTFNLVLAGQDHTGFGLLLAGDDNQGSVVVRDISTPLRVNGDNNTVEATVRSAANATVIAGNNNIVTLDTDGDVDISGNGNVIVGQISGNLTLTGAGNKISGKVVGNISNTTADNNDIADVNVLRGASVWDPASIAAGGSESRTIAIAGADRSLHRVEVHFSRPLDGLIPTAFVSNTAGQVTVRLENPTGATIDMSNSAVNLTLRRV